MVSISQHADFRMSQRGIGKDFLEKIIEYADVDVPQGGNCRLLRVHWKTARHLNISDRLARYAVIWSDDSHQVVTVLPIHQGKGRNRYSRIH